jgi:hypothetical protein
LILLPNAISMSAMSLLFITIRAKGSVLHLTKVF